MSRLNEILFEIFYDISQIPITMRDLDALGAFLKQEDDLWEVVESSVEPDGPFLFAMRALRFRLASQLYTEQEFSEFKKLWT